VNKLVIDGVSNIDGGEYDEISIKGVSECKGDLKAKTLAMEGILKSRGSVNADLLNCNGILEVKSNIKAETIKLEGIVKSIGKIEANQITGKGLIFSKAEISADVINIEGILKATEVVGDSITLKPYNEGVLTRVWRKYSKLELVEATTIHLVRAYVKNVNGKDITIGPKCKVENIDCSGTLSIDKTAVVKNITGNYTLQK